MRPTITAAQVYGATLPGISSAPIGASEAASGPEDVETLEGQNLSISPAIALLAIIGGLVVVRLVWEYAGE